MATEDPVDAASRPDATRPDAGRPPDADPFDAAPGATDLRAPTDGPDPVGADARPGADAASVVDARPPGPSDGGLFPDTAPAADATPPAPLGPGLTPLPPMPGGPRQEVAAVALGAEIHVVGGLDPDERLLTRVEIFDTRTRRWRAGVDLPVPVSHANLAALDGRLYLLGFLGRRFVPDARGFVLEPGAAAWTPGPALPPGRVRGGAGVVVDRGRILVLGGFAVRAVPFADACDPSTGAWTPLPDLPEPRDHLAAARLGGEVLVTGGTAGVPEQVLGTSWALDEAAATWRARGALRVPRGVGAAAVLAGRLHVFGGEGLGPGAPPGGVYGVVEVYDPDADAFSPSADLPEPLRGLGAAGVEGAVYLFGGATALGTAPVDTARAFVP